jgi:hypothetical protein
MNVRDGLVALAYLCEKNEIYFELSYETGRYVPGELIDFDNIGAEPKPENIRQGPKGWRIMIGGYYVTDDETGKRELQSLAVAVTTGLQMVKQIMDERIGESGFDPGE